MGRKTWATALLLGFLLGSARAKNLGPELRKACVAGDVNRVSLLLQKGAPIEEGDELGRTPLILACYGNPAVVKLLLARGANVNGVSKVNNSALGDAADTNHLENVRLLVEAGADINHVSNFGRTPLAMAAESGNDDIVSYLISHKCDVNKAEPASALAYALHKGHLSTAKLLVAAGAIVRPTPHPPNAPIGSWWPMAMNAVVTGDQELVDFILDQGADLNEKDPRGLTALNYLVIQTKNEALIGHLLERGADPDARRRWHAHFYVGGELPKPGRYPPHGRARSERQHSG